ncbi:MAG: hypothetical protein AB8G11_04140 [Saprospiraceae bacterium]
MTRFPDQSNLNLKELKEMLTDGEILEVIDILKPKAKDEKSLILIETQYKQHKKERRNGTLSYADFKTQKLRITKSLLEILENWK